jgi:branched-subunit amino acid aminotransferase/4-amino-4-deoxychorismate lyase
VNSRRNTTWKTPCFSSIVPSITRLRCTELASDFGWNPMEIGIPLKVSFEE